MDKLTVLIVEDNAKDVNEIKEYAATLDDVEVVSACNSAENAIKDIQSYMPAAVILDLELQLGGGSGLDVLRRLRENMRGYKPFILVTTVNTSNSVQSYARTLGADYFIYKHQQGYTPRYAIDFLRNIRDDIINTYVESTTYSETPHAMEVRIRNRIKAELYEIGISPKLVGFTYLVDGIELLVNGPVTLLTEVIAQKYNKTKNSVDKAIQNAIDYAWKHTDIDTLQKNFRARIRAESGVPTIMEFVYYYADKIREEFQL